MVDILHGDVPVMLDVLHLLTVSVWLLQSLDNKSCSRRTNRNLKFVPSGIYKHTKKLKLVNLGDNMNTYSSLPILHG